MLLAVLFCLGLISAGFAQETLETQGTAGQATRPSQQPNLGGASGVYGDANNQYFFCHDVDTGVYQYTYVNGFGYGNLTQASDGTWTGRGVWLECGFVGGEILSVDNNTITSNWFYNEEGDTARVLGGQQPQGTQQQPAGTQQGGNTAQGLFISARRVSPQLIQKRNNSIPTLDECWWLNTDVDTTKTNLNGHWSSQQFDQSTCLIGNKFARSHYNGSVEIGMISGTVQDWVAFTGNSEDFFDITCLQGCELHKVGRDGNTLFEKFWCGLNADNTKEIAEDVYHRQPNPVVDTEVPLCLFAPQPSFGYTVHPLSNATFSS